MKAATTRRPFLPAWVSTFLAKCTRQRCRVAHSTIHRLQPMDPISGGDARRGALFQNLAAEQIAHRYGQGLRHAVQPDAVIGHVAVIYDFLDQAGRLAVRRGLAFIEKGQRLGPEAH